MNRHVIHKHLLPRYDAALAEIAVCRRKGLAYVASCPISFQVIVADEARRNGNIREAIMLECAAREIARAQAVAMVAARRGHVRMKAKKTKK